MHQAEFFYLLPEAQYGSRRAKSVAMIFCNKVLFNEVAQTQPTPMGYCSTDARFIFDRTNHSFASLSIQKLGAPNNVACCMFRTIQSMYCTIRYVPASEIQLLLIFLV